MTEHRRLRYSCTKRYTCGDETRRKIIVAAIAQFGLYGFDVATTRGIAACAGVNAPALQYYFESKEGLYRACAESLANEAWKALEPVVLRAQISLERNESGKELIESFIEIQYAVFNRMLAQHSSTDQRLFFARELSGCEPEAGSQVLQERLRRPLNVVNVALLARICNIREDDPLTSVRLLTLYGQFSLFFLMHRSTHSPLGWGDIDVEKAEFIQAHLSVQSRVLLERWYIDSATITRHDANRSSSVIQRVGSEVQANSPSLQP